MNDLDTFKNLYKAQVNGLNANAESMNAAHAQIVNLRRELEVAQQAFDALQAARDNMKRSARGTLAIIREHEATARAEAERLENAQFV